MRMPFVALALVPVVATGCGSGQPPVVPVVGKVVLKQKDGKLVPMGGAKLVFVPVRGADTAVAFPSARASADGSFRLGTSAAADGTPEGDYVVTVEWKERYAPKHNLTGLDEIDRGPDKLGGKYADRTTSPLRASVIAGQDLTVVVPTP